jgi:hypothetical protein
VIIQAAYFVTLGLLALFGLHRLYLVWLLWRRRAATVPAAWDETPHVTVQLPIYNELYVVERLIAAVAALRWPRARLEIQVLDDSDDATAERAARAVASYRAAGLDIHHVRRGTREGWKAGALAEGLRRARGEVVAIFDADFVPPPDFLVRTVPHLAAPGVGMVQARWGHTNRAWSWLTRAQATMLDAHFLVEHAARHRAGRFFNFNGTAGVFRRRCLEDAGGWQHDTLTEDLDLSYRAQLAGWRFVFLPDCIVPAELPVEVDALRAQQRRWALGSMQTAVKLLPRLMKAPLPAAVKLEAAAHLGGNLAWLLLAALSMLIVPSLAVRARHEAAWWMADLPLLLCGTATLALFFAAAAVRSESGRRLRALADIPAAMAVGIGLSLTNGLAVLEGLCARRAEFVRTPKYDIGAAGKAEGWLGRAYAGPRSGMALAEAAFAAYFALGAVLAAARGWYGALPFLLLFAGGFGYVAGLTWLQRRGRVRSASARKAAEAARWSLQEDRKPLQG